MPDVDAALARAAIFAFGGAVSGCRAGREVAVGGEVDVGAVRGGAKDALHGGAEQLSRSVYGEVAEAFADGGGGVEAVEVVAGFAAAGSTAQ